MSTPRSRMEQRSVHIRGEVLRGCGAWPSWGIECVLEPPFEPFHWNGITAWDLAISGFERPYQGVFIDRLKRLFQPLTTVPFSDYYRRGERDGMVHLVSVAHYADDEITYHKAEQLLLALSTAREPIAFELFAIGESHREYAGQPRIEVRFGLRDADVPLLTSQLHNHYPRSAVVDHELGWEEEDFEWNSRVWGDSSEEDPIYVAPLVLDAPYCFPLRTYPSFDTDPLGVPVAVMDELGDDQWALLSVLFTRAKQPWAENLHDACVDPYNTGKPYDDSLDLRLLAQKLETPLFAVAATLVSNSPRVLTNLTAWTHQYETPRNRLIVRNEAIYRNQWPGIDPPSTKLWREALNFRQTLFPGMLLSARELVGLAHLPNPDLPTERLLRVRTQTRKPPKPVLEATTVTLGENTHRGQVQSVAIPLDMRYRHCYLAGSTGTGKSTLLLNMILQDIAAGHGVGLLDPHGDLVKEVLRRIPKERIDDVILFDPSDTAYPFALNILEAHDEDERERIVAETIMSLERYFPASWGPRLERILQYTIRTVLHAVPGATLADVERMLTDEGYRNTVVGKTTDGRLLQYWHTQFKHLPKNAIEPVLNKLSVFLLDRSVRNIVCQRHAAINFDQLLNEGKILLANLSTGLLTEKVAGTLGSFLVTKIVNMALRRAAIPEDARRPWYFYIDEFQKFMNVSVGFETVLTEARKYRLVLAGMANQYVGQLSPGVRQAVFGNVGSMVVFRLGVEDANAVARELGVFTATDVLNLEVGQAIVRIGTAATAFNLQTFLPPPVSTDDPTEEIVRLARERYAKPRAVVEEELGEVAQEAKRLESILDFGAEPSDPSEDDLVT